MSEDEQQTCNACGFSISREFDQTVQKQDDDADHTPTQIKSTKPPDEAHITTSGSGRFVAGTVLINRYRIVDLLGKGGMGEVYKAEDLELDQIVAFKFLPEKLAKNEELPKRFRGEARFRMKMCAASLISARRKGSII